MKLTKEAFLAEILWQLIIAMVRPGLTCFVLWTGKGLESEFILQMFGTDVSLAILMLLAISGLESTELSVRGGFSVKTSAALSPRFLLCKCFSLCSFQLTVVLMLCSFFVLRG